MGVIKQLAIEHKAFLESHGDPFNSPEVKEPGKPIKPGKPEALKIYRSFHLLKKASTLGTVPVHLPCMLQ
jgi:hypothetical protein